MTCIFFSMLLASCGIQTKSKSAAEEPKLEQLALSDSAVVVDVRTPEEFASGHINGSINIPVDVITDYVDSLRQYKNVITVCRSGVRAAAAVRALKGEGLRNVYSGGGWQSFNAMMEGAKKIPAQ